MIKPSPNIAVVGATGAVGREMLRILEQRRFGHGNLRLLASERSAGTRIDYRGQSLVVEPLTESSFGGVDLALFSAGGSISRTFGPIAAAAGSVVIDNSSAFRMDPGVPLVIPEINPDALEGVLDGTTRIVANPNCSTIIMLVPLEPLRAAFGIERIVVSTYQAASGAGARGMAELQTQTRAAVENRTEQPDLFPEPYAFNLFSHNSAVDPRTGRNTEEQKMIDETRKIWSDPEIGVSATCIRVPVLRAHSESINVTLKRPATTARVVEALREAPGVKLVDDRSGNRFPTPAKAADGDDVLVGRIRPDSSRPAGDAGPDAPCIGFDLFVCGDQLRKGAALNAIQIAERLIAESARRGPTRDASAATSRVP